MIVLDTNVVSELMKRHPAEQVVSWVRDQRLDAVFTTSFTVAEIRYGIERLPPRQAP
jgi:predicted nucleic acid-binding protein